MTDSTADQSSFQNRLQKAGIDVQTATTCGFLPLDRHIRSIQAPIDEWLPVLEDFIHKLHAQDIKLWSPLTFILPALLSLTGSRLEVFKKTLAEIETLLETLNRHAVDPQRCEQYAVQTAAEAFDQDDASFVIALQFAIRLAEADEDPSWALEKIVPSLWHASRKGADRFKAMLITTENFIGLLHANKISAVFPIAIGLTDLAYRASPTTDEWSRWLDRLGKIALSLQSNGLDCYEFFEYSFATSLLEGATMTLALEIALALADKGFYATRLLRENFGSPSLPSSSSNLEAAMSVSAELAQQGIDPTLIVCHGLQITRHYFPCKEAASRILALGRELHRKHFNVPQIFEVGFPILMTLEEKIPGFFARGFTLVEALVHQGIDPTLTLVYSLPRALLRYAENRPWLADACIQLADQFIDAGVNPEAFLAYGVPSILRLVDTDPIQFRTLAKRLTEFSLTLEATGVRHRDVLFHDLQSIAEMEQSDAFIEVLTKLENLVHLLIEKGLDPTSFLMRGLPRALKSAEKTRWLITMILDTSAAWVRRGNNPLPLLENAIDPLLDASRRDEHVFRAFWSVLENHLSELPTTFSFLIEAAVAPADQSSSRFEEGLALLLKWFNDSRLTDEERDHFAHSLPQAASAADAPTDLITISRSLRDGWSLLSHQKPLLAAWETEALKNVSKSFARRPREAIDAWLALARTAKDLKTAPSVLLHHGSRAAASVDDKTVANFLKTFSLVTACAERLSDSGFDVEWAFPKVMAIVYASRHASPSELSTVLDVMTNWAIQIGPHAPALYDQLNEIKIVLERWPQAWSALIAPTLKAHGRHSLKILETLCRVTLKVAHLESDLDILREVVTQNGVKSVDILHNLIYKSEDLSTHLTADKDYLTGFIRDVGCWDIGLYSRYVSYFKNSKLTLSERRIKIHDLKESFMQVSLAIRSGTLSVEQESNSLFGMALVYLFPPSVSETRQSYVSLYETFPDRPEDVESRSTPPELRRRRYNLGQGSWQLRKGVSVSAVLWTPFVRAMKAAQLELPIEKPVTLGWDLLQAWTETRLSRDRSRQDYLPRALRRARQQGFAWPTATDTAAQLLAMKEILTDRLRDVIEEALLAARNENPGRYDRLIGEKLQPVPTLGPKLIKSIMKTLDQHRRGGLPDADVSQRLAGQLREFSVDAATILTDLKEVVSTETLVSAISKIGPRVIPREAGQEIHRLHADWLGQDLHAIQEELFGIGTAAGALEYADEAASFDMVFEVTKRRAHACVGFAEGVCVARDLALWNRPEFLQTIFWDDEGIGRGGMHLLIVDEKHLCLPGVNPSTELLERVKASAILDAAVDYAWRLARAWNLADVWIPSAVGIYSNRRSISIEVEKRGWEVLTTSTFPFSYSPFAYSVSSVFNVPEPKEYVNQPK